MVSSLIPWVWIRTECIPSSISMTPTLTVWWTFPTLMFSEFWFCITPSPWKMGCRETFSARSCSLSPWSCSPPRWLLAVLLTWRSASCSHLGVGSHRGAGGWGSYIWKSKCSVASFAYGWYSVSHIHSSPVPGFLNFTRLPIFQNYLYLFPILFWERNVDFILWMYL